MAKRKIFVSEPMNCPTCPPCPPTAPAGMPVESKNAVKARLLEIQGKVQEMLQIIESV